MIESPKQHHWSFIPTISFDGVAMISFAVIVCIWFGVLKETVREHGETIRHLVQIQETQSETLKVMASQVAVLTALVNERTGNAKK